MPEGKLVIVPTPLGNLGDMTPRALDTLRNADCICCEDTRVTGRLLAALGIEGVRLERLDETMLGARAGDVIERVQAGQTIAYCTDAGMPGVSDPGQRLVASAYEHDIAVEVLPGPAAAITAYVASGFTCPRFYFGGFFPRKQGEREKTIEMLRSLDAVALFYESPHRIADALCVLAKELPTRKAAVCRELTKMHEEVAVNSIEELAQEFAQRQRDNTIKGEIVLVVDTANEDEQQDIAQQVLQKAAEEVDRLHAEGVLTKKDMVAHLQAEFGIARNEAYELVHGA